MTQNALFDYYELDVESRALVRERTDEIRALMRRTAEDIIAIGRKLEEVKQRLGHGRFLDWLTAEFGWHRATANRFMQVAEAFSPFEKSQIATFAPSALYLLAAPAAPETARAEALERAAAGESITYGLARGILARHLLLPLTAGELHGYPDSGPAPEWPEQGEVGVDITDSVTDGSGVAPVVSSSPHGAASVDTLAAGVEQWLSDRWAAPDAQAAVLAEIAARTTAGMDHLNALLTSGALPAPFRNRDVVQACRIVLARLPGTVPAADAFAAIVPDWADPALAGPGVDPAPEPGAVDEPAPALKAQPISVDWPLGLACDLGPVVIIRGDARQMSTPIGCASQHLVITSPPYNVGTGYRSHDDALADDEYTGLLRAAFAQCCLVMVDGARIAVVVPAGVGRNPWRPLASRVAALLVETGLTLRGQVIWDKGTCGNRTSWGSFRLPTDPSLRDTTETIVVAHKGSSHLAVPEGCLRRDASGPYSPFMPDADTFMALAQDHWMIPPESATAVGHPAPFPIALAERLIRFYAYPGAQVLDPFAGSGTTGLAALRLGCRATLVDIDASYCDLAKRRCERELSSR